MDRSARATRHLSLVRRGAVPGQNAMLENEVPRPFGRCVAPGPRLRFGAAGTPTLNPSHDLAS